MGLPSSTFSASGSLCLLSWIRLNTGKHSLLFPWEAKRKRIAGQLRDNSLQRNPVSNLSDPSLALSYTQAGGERRAKSSGAGLGVRSATLMVCTSL